MIRAFLWVSFHLQTGNDYYYHEVHGHIANIIVAPRGERRGIGRILMTKGEEWARSQGFRLALRTFPIQVDRIKLPRGSGHSCLEKSIIKFARTQGNHCTIMDRSLVQNTVGHGIERVFEENQALQER